MTREEQAVALEKDWQENSRWASVKRGYSAADVVRLRGSVQPENTLAVATIDIVNYSNNLRLLTD